jgi:hypothetical protein
MAFDGNGTFNQATTPVVSGTVISSTNYNSQNTDYNNGLSNVICRDGQSTILANLPMSNYRHTGVGNAVARNDYAAAGQVQDGAFIWCGTAGGTADALTLTPSPAITAYAAGQEFRFRSGASPNTGATTVVVSGLSAQALQLNGAALNPGDIAASRQYTIRYDGTNFQLIGVGGSVADGSITNAKLANMAANTVKARAANSSGVPSDVALAASQLLGRGATGDVAAITLGPGLSMAGATLSAAGNYLGRAYAEYTTVTSVTATIPLDSTIPQNTEGTQLISQAYTPISASSRVRITSRVQFDANTGSTCIAALFNGGANAIAASMIATAGAGFPNQLIVVHEYAPGSTSLITFTLRVGPPSGTMFLNQDSSSRTLGGVMKCTMVIEEVA